MPKPTKNKQLSDSYRFHDFRPSAAVTGVFGDRHARVVRLNRRSKKQSAASAGASSEAGTIANRTGSAIYRAVGRVSISKLTSDASIAGAAVA
jgi:hypothetical protein